MSKLAKVNKVAVQKGPIVADQKTMKTMSRKEINVEDAGRRALLDDGMTLKMMTPKR